MNAFNFINWRLMSGEDNKKAWGGIAIGVGSGGAGHDPKNCGDVVALPDLEIINATVEWRVLRVE